MMAGRVLVRTMPRASAMNSCRETSFSTTTWLARAARSKCDRIALPFVFQDAQCLVERQQLTAQLLLECQRFAEHLRLNARLRLGAVCADGVTRTEPGQRDQHQRRDDDCSAANPANPVALSM